MKWTAEELELLQCLCAANVVVKEIHRQLPIRSLSAIRMKMCELGLRTRRIDGPYVFQGFYLPQTVADRILQGHRKLGITKSEYIRRACERCPIDVVAAL